MNHFFTVVIPLFNKEEYIIKTINSVLNQSYTNFEIVVVDDGSTDKSIAKVLSLDDSRIKIISQKNMGVSVARNTGIINSGSKWVALLDGDDEYFCDFLKTVNDFLNKHEKENFSFIGTNYIIESNNTIAVGSNIKDGIYDYFSLFGNLKSPNNSSTTVINKDFFNLTGGFPEGVRQFEDWITWFKLGVLGSFGYISKPLGKYNRVEGSAALTKRTSQDLFHDVIALPKSINEMLLVHKVEKGKLLNLSKCVTEFSILLARIFARNGEILYALKTLKYAQIILVFFYFKKQFLFVLFQILCPQFLKQIYWKIRYGKSNISNS